MKTFLITGGAGFIGSHLADALLAAGHTVRVLDDFSTGRRENVHRSCDLRRGDVCDPAAVREAMRGVSGCFHLAAIASVVRANEDWAGTHRVNLGGTINILDAARQQGGVPVVYASSAAVYGRLAGIADEASPTMPLSAYGADKRGCELHATAGTVVHGIPTLGFRFFNVYGPRQDPFSPYSGVISIFARAIAAGEPVTVHGDGQQTRDLIFVADVVRFLAAGMAALETGQRDLAGTVLNACTGKETTVMEMARTIGLALGAEVEFRSGPSRDGDIRRSVGSPMLAKAMLGIAAQTSLRQGLELLLDRMESGATLLAV